MKIFYASAAEITPDFKSHGIMKFLGTNYSHVLHIIEPEAGEPFLWHSTGEGVNCKLLRDFLQTHRLIHKFDVTDRLIVSADRFLGYLEGNEGKDYSETQYAGFINDVFKRRVGDGPSELICSEFTARSANKYTSLQIKGDEDFVTPKMFIEAIESYNLINIA